MNSLQEKVNFPQFILTYIYIYLSCLNNYVQPSFEVISMGTQKKHKKHLKIR